MEKILLLEPGLYSDWVRRGEIDEVPGLTDRELGLEYLKVTSRCRGENGEGTVGGCAN